MQNQDKTTPQPPYDQATIQQNPYATPVNPQMQAPSQVAYQQIPPLPPNPYFTPLMTPKQAHKKSLKRDASKASGLLCILNVVAGTLSMAVMFIYIAILMRSYSINVMNLPNSTDLESLLLSSTALFLTGMLPIIIVEIIVILIARPWFQLKLKSDMFTKPHMKSQTTALACFACLGAGVVGSFVYELISLLYGKLNIEVIAPDFSLPKENILFMILTLLYICILGPILEEIIFRGFILKSLQKHGELFAILLSSILFALFHMNIQQLAHPFLIGLILGYITVKSKSIVPAVICHIFNNSIAMALDYFIVEDTLQGDMIAYIYMVVSLIALAVFIFFHFKNFRAIPKGDATYMKTGKKLFSGLTAAGSIVFICIFLSNIAVLTFLGWLKNNMPPSQF